MLWRGSVQDDHVAAALALCTKLATPQLHDYPVLPGNAAQAAWSTALTMLLAAMARARRLRSTAATRPAIAPARH